jgi:hypothetical protein
LVSQKNRVVGYLLSRSIQIPLGGAVA